MTITQAISILKDSKPLAVALVSSNLQLALYPDEGKIIIEFQKIVDAGLAQDPELYKSAGLDVMQYNALLARLAYHHARGDDKPDPGAARLGFNN